ncbi:RNA pseudouridine synthase, partial [Patescibacteria group bacterium]|nr:RNA pseudouridine synthase [Patescibacteria group bacterium]
MEKEPEIVFEDKNLLLLDKPAGWVSSKERREEKNPTVEEWLTGKVDLGLARNGLVHRLDKGTSGLLLVAKNIKSLLNLKKQFKQRRVKKKYWALVGGDVV